MKTELLQAPQVATCEEEPISSTATLVRDHADQAELLDSMLGALGIARPNRLRLQADTDRWDRFWQRHGDGDGIFDRLLWPTRKVFSNRHAKLLLEYLWRHAASPVEPLRVLEIGCGSATTSSFIARETVHAAMYGVDLSMAAIKLARTRNPRLHCVVADAVALPFARERFSLAFSSGVIEHFDRGIAGLMHAEHCRVARNGGIVGLIVPWKHSPYNLLRILSGKHWPFGHEKPFSIRELRKFARNHCLRQVEVRTSYGATLTGIGRKQEVLPYRYADAYAMTLEQEQQY